MVDRKRLMIAAIFPVLIMLVPDSICLKYSVSLVEQRFIAIMAMAVICWAFEIIPVYATSIMVIVMQLLFISDKGFAFLINSGGYSERSMGNIISHRDIMNNFAHPLILLFLGGFFISIAIRKLGLDKELARFILNFCGSRPEKVMLGIIFTTAFFSMFMSNTATTAMMMALMAPVIDAFDGGDKGKIAFVLAVPFAANIGGIGTPIGTPPNAVAMKYLTDSQSVTFGEWMGFAVPFVVVMLFFLWKLLLRMYPAQTEAIDVDFNNDFKMGKRHYLVAATCLGTILLWITGSLHGLSTSVVAMIPVMVFLVSGILNREDLEKVNWDVLWLVSGGFALGMGIEKTGLCNRILELLKVEVSYLGILLLLVILVTVLMSSFMSHTVAVNLLLPVIATFQGAFPQLIHGGDMKMIIIAVALSSSMAMALPISTPPNSIAYASGHINTAHLFRSGILIGVAGITVLMLTIQVIR